MSSPGSIFISYRRTDAPAFTGRIYDRLVAEFGEDQIVLDVDTIPLGTDFAEFLDQAVSRCQVLLVVIGKTWPTVAKPDGTPRLLDPDDFVRIEVESALRRGIPVIPVLLDGVSMPTRAQLPDSLHPLVRRNGMEVGHNPRFHPDMTRLIKGLQPLLREGLPVGSYDSIREGLVNQSLNPPAEMQDICEDLGGGVILDMAAIPGGIFPMGSPEDEPGRYDAEGPQHEVTVPAFLIGRDPVTQAQWRAVSALPKIKRELNPAPSHFKGPGRPVEQVSWFEAVEFCHRLSCHTGKEYRLPSEAEWEYACRAGTTAPYSFGQELGDTMANFRGYKGGTTDVGNYPANDFGLYDMHGNVYEWCQDNWHENYDGAPMDGSAWLPGSEERMIRGGSWVTDSSWYCRSAFRYGYSPGDRVSIIGFRVSCAAPRAL